MLQCSATRLHISTLLLKQTAYDNRFTKQMALVVADNLLQLLVQVMNIQSPSTQANSQRTIVFWAYTMFLFFTRCAFKFWTASWRKNGFLGFWRVPDQESSLCTLFCQSLSHWLNRLFVPLFVYASLIIDMIKESAGCTNGVAFAWKISTWCSALVAQRVPPSFDYVHCSCLPTRLSFSARSSFR